MDPYRELGLDLQRAVNAAEAGITEVWNLLVSDWSPNWFREFALPRFVNDYLAVEPASETGAPFGGLPGGG